MNLCNGSCRSNAIALGAIVMQVLYSATALKRHSLQHIKTVAKRALTSATNSSSEPNESNSRNDFVVLAAAT